MAISVFGQFEKCSRRQRYHPHEVANTKFATTSCLLDRGLTHFAYCGFSDHHWSELRQQGFREELAKISVPEEAAVIGVDNDDVICDFCQPPLSSVIPAAERIGFEAAAMLDQLMRGGTLATPHVTVAPLGIASRQSTDKPTGKFASNIGVGFAGGFWRSRRTGEERISVFLGKSHPRKESLSRSMKRLLPWLIGLSVLVVRKTCRFRIHYDPRDGLTAEGIPHVFAQLHAHQVAAGMAANPGTGAMVSRSEDGEMIVPTLKLLGHIPIRGSAGNNSRKGGVQALQTLIKHVRNGHPAILAVDGPRGPRGRVHKGIGMLAKKTDAAVLAVIVIPARRWILSKTWDRLQIPKPFTTIRVYLSEPLFLGKDEKLEAFAERVEIAIHELEMRYDPTEAQPLKPKSAVIPSDRIAA